MKDHDGQLGHGETKPPSEGTANNDGKKRSVDEKEISCEFCKKSFNSTSLLRHIGKTKACKSFYGSRFDYLKRQKDSDRKRKYRNNMTSKEE